MKGKERITLEREKREDMVKAIISYFKNERGEEIGQLAAGLFLDLVIEKLAPEFYNQGVLDSCAYMDEKAEDMRSLLL
ncbi:MAG TPA: DUF2164 domain-containing protein [Methanomassiliicoccales archaeon]|nr:DUF2164 domain-containing protein [Methanomassiliicoccales archaeon]